MLDMVEDIKSIMRRPSVLMLFRLLATLAIPSSSVLWSKETTLSTTKVSNTVSQHRHAERVSIDFGFDDGYFWQFTAQVGEEMF